MDTKCNCTACNYCRDGRCLDASLRDPYKQTGCILYSGKVVSHERK